MGFQVFPTVEIEVLGARWRMGQPTGGAIALQKAWLRSRTLADAGAAPEDLPVDDVYAAYCRYFCEAVRGWDGVIGAGGMPLPFTPENVRDIPPDVQAEVVLAAIARRADLEGNASGPDEPPMTSEGPADA